MAITKQITRRFYRYRYSRLARIQLFCSCCKTLLQALATGLPLQKAISLTATAHPIFRRQSLAYHTTVPLLQVLSAILPKEMSLPIALDKEIPHLTDLLSSLERSYKARLHMIQTIQKELRYPLFLLVMSLSLLFVFWMVLLPMYLSLFDSLSVPLPKALQLMTKMRQTLLSAPSPLLITCISFCLLGLYKGYHYGIHWIYKDRPGDTLGVMGLFCDQSFSIKETLDLAQKTPMGRSKDFQKLYTRCHQSGRFTQSFNQTYKLPQIYTQQLEHAESLGQLESKLTDVSRHCQEYYLQQQKRYLQLLPVLCLLLIAALIIVMGYLSYMPLLNSIQSFG